MRSSNETASSDEVIQVLIDVFFARVVDYPWWTPFFVISSELRRAATAKIGTA